MEGRLNFLSNISPSFILLFGFFPGNKIGKLFLGYTCRHVRCWSPVYSWIMPLNSIINFHGIWSSTSKKGRVANNTTMKRTHTLYQENHEPFSQFLLIVSVFMFYCAK